jgi:hypothetical protein
LKKLDGLELSTCTNGGQCKEYKVW